MLHFRVKIVKEFYIVSEALVRWQHPEYGILTPYEFLHFCDDKDVTSMASNATSGCVKQPQKLQIAGFKG